MPPDPPRTASRTVYQADAIAWLSETRIPADWSIVTSLPDVSEMSGMNEARWRQWFVDATSLVCRAVSDDAVAIFFQTDVKSDGRWVDKGFLVQCGAEAAASSLLWHKIVCRAPAGTVTFGRPAYAHLMCFSRTLRLAPAQSSADVLPRLGAMTWARAMGVEACEATCRFLLAHTGCKTVLDPFCGIGTMLAVANAYGLDAVGVERSAKRAEKARTLAITRT